MPGAAVRWSRDITGHVTVSGACWRLLDARETVRLVLCFQPHRQPGFYFNLENRRLGFNIVVWRGDSISTAERVLLRSQVFLYQSWALALSLGSVLPIGRREVRIHPADIY